MTNPTRPQPTKWTWLELLGLSLAFFMIVWPIANLVMATVFPPTAQGAAAFTVTKSPGFTNAAPGTQIVFTIVIRANATGVALATPVGLTDVVSPLAVVQNASCTAGCQYITNPVITGNTVTTGQNGGTTYPAGATSTIQIRVRISPAANGQQFTNNATVVDSTNASYVSNGAVVNIGGNGNVPTPTPIPTNTPNPKPTVTPTNTPLPTATSTPTNTPTNTALAGVLTPLPLPTRLRGTTPTSTVNNVQQFSTPTPTFTAAPRNTPTLRPDATDTASLAEINANTGGAVTGVFIAGTNDALNGYRVELVSRRNNVEQVLANTLIDNTGQYSFLSVAPTRPNEVYFVRFSNPNGGNSLKSWNSVPFTFKGGRVQAPIADLADVILGNPGEADNTFQLPLTLNWNNRGQGDAYSVTIYQSSNKKVAYTSGNLGAVNSLTLPAGTVAAGDYYAEVTASNANGSGVSSRQFRFRISDPTLAPTATDAPVTAALPTPTLDTTPTISPTLTTTPDITVTATPDITATVTATPTLTTTPTISPTLTITPDVTATPVTATPSVSAGATSTAVIAGVQGELSPTAAPIVSLNTPTVATSDGNSPTATTVTVSPKGTPLPQTTPTPPSKLPPGTNSLPQSGGELPFAGLVLAAFTLVLRRIRLVVQTRR